MFTVLRSGRLSWYNTEQLLLSVIMASSTSPIQGRLRCLRACRSFLFLCARVCVLRAESACSSPPTHPPRMLTGADIFTWVFLSAASGEVTPNVDCGAVNLHVLLLTPLSQEGNNKILSCQELPGRLVVWGRRDRFTQESGFLSATLIDS